MGKHRWGSRPCPPKEPEDGASSGTSLLLSEQREQSDEDVDEVEVQCHGTVHRVVQRVGDAQRSVEVEDHERREQQQPEPVEHGHRASHGDTESGEEDDAELPNDEQQEQPDEREPPGRQILGDERTDETEANYEERSEREDFGDGRGGVERDHRAEQYTERDGEHEERHPADERIVVGTGHPGRAERDQEEHQHETEHPPAAHGAEVDHRAGPLCRHRRDGDADGGEAGDSEQVGPAAHGRGSRVVDAVPDAVVEEAFVGHLSS